MKTKFMFKKGMPMVISAMLTLMALLTANLQAAVMPPLLQPANSDSWNSYYYGDYQKGGEIKLASEYKLVKTSPSSWNGTYLFTNGTSNSTWRVFKDVSTAENITVSDSTITNPTTGSEITVENISGNYYAIKSNGLYIGDDDDPTFITTTSKPTSTDTKYLWTFSLNSAKNVTIKNVAHTSRYFKYHASSYKRFRSLTSSTTDAVHPYLFLSTVPTTSYEKVTSEPTDWCGEYILAYDKSTTEAWAFNGTITSGHSGYETLTTSSGVISNIGSAKKITIEQYNSTHYYTINIDGVGYLHSGTDGFEVYSTASNVEDDYYCYYSISYSSQGMVIYSPGWNKTYYLMFMNSDASHQYFGEFATTNNYWNYAHYTSLYRNTESPHCGGTIPTETPAPTHCNGTGMHPVKFGSCTEIVNNTSSYPTSSPYYINNTSMIGGYEPGDEAAVEMSFETLLGYTGIDYGVVIWVDWDKDAVFEDSEVVFRGTSTTPSYVDPGTLTATFSIPNDADGNYTMRIGAADIYFDDFIQYGTSNYAHDPCYAGNSYAVFHDYTLHVNAAGFTGYTITCNTASGGSITDDANHNACAGQEVTITATPDDCYYLSGLSYDDGSYHYIYVENNSGTFTMPAHSVTVSATFDELTPTNYSLTINTPENGSVTINGANTLTYSTSACASPTVTLSATPNTSYKFDGWYNGSTLVSTDNPCNYTLPEGSTTLTAQFSELVLAISPASGTYPLGQQVTLTGPGTIYYTTDGTTPTTSSTSAQYTETITLGPGITTVKLTDGTTTLSETYVVVADNSELECHNNNGVAGTVSSGLYTSKTVNYDNNTYTGTITLESFVTGTVTTTQGGVQPMDIILVLDYSGSMSAYKPNGDKYGDFDINRSESRYVALQDAVNAFLAAVKAHPSAYENQGESHRVAFVTFNNSGMTFYGMNGSGNDVFMINNQEYTDTGNTHYWGGTFSEMTVDGNSYIPKMYNYSTSGSVTTTNPDTCYAKAFYNIQSTAAAGSSSAETAWNIIAEKRRGTGNTYIPNGMWAAERIFANNSTETSISGVTRQRMVVVLTDGQPYNDYKYDYTDTHWNATCYATGTNVTGFANATINLANELKNVYKATVYSIGIFNTSNSTEATSLPAYDDYNGYGTSPHCIDRFMHLISSNETTATTLCADPSDWSQKGCYMAASSASAITSAFTNVAAQISASSNFNLDETALVSDVINPDFIIPTDALSNPNDLSGDGVKIYKRQATGLSYGASEGYTTDEPCYDSITWGAPTNLSSYGFEMTENGVTVTGFNFNDNEVFYSTIADPSHTPPIVVGWNGWKLVIEIPIELAAHANGESETSSDNVFHGDYETNSSSGIYLSDGTAVSSICSPTANVDFGKVTWTQAVNERPSSFPTDATITAGGANYYIPITCENDLAWFISYVNGMNGAGAHPNAKAELKADLDMSECIWVPIGYNVTHKYTGKFNGNNHTVKGINIANETQSSYVSWRHNDSPSSVYYMGTNLVEEGFFGYTDGAEINDFFLTGGTLVTDNDDTESVNLGGLAGYTYGTTINFCESAINLMANCNAHSIGGLVGQAETGTKINAAMVMGDIDANGKAVANLGGVTGVSGENVVTTYFTNHTISNDANVLLKNNSFGHNGYVRISNNGYDLGYTPSQFSETSAYTYGSYATNNTVSGTPLVDLLNDDSNLSTDYKWIRPAGSVINGDYPIIVKTTNDGSAVVNETTDGKVIRYYEINKLLGMEKYQNANNSVFMYNNDTLTVAPSNTKLYIDEHVALTQADNISIPAYVGITFDNSNGVLGEESRDWHMFSSTIAAGKVGISYGSQASVYSETLNFGSDYSMMSQESDNTIYLPDGIGNGSQFDLYSFYEPQYHWINLKRAGNNHWKQDSTTVQIHYNGGGPTDSNEPTYTVGKGYLIALGDKTNANNNFMQAYGTLNNGQTNIDIPVTVSGAHLTGYNLLGNPFQSYLDFSKFATANSSIWGSESANNGYIIYDADKGGFICYGEGLMGVQPSIGSATAGQYLHPHQGFLVLAENEGTVKFNNGMRSRTASDVVFRNGQPAYPVVNLFCTDSEGNNEITVVEIERPETAGVRKPKGLLNGDGQMYARWNNTDFGLLFIDHTPDYVPMWFDAIKDAVFTMTWSTANDNFGYLHLVDNMTGADVDMLEADSYTFESHVTDMSARFRLVFKPLGIEEETTEQGENFAFFNGSELIVNGEGELSLIDLNGRVLTTQYVTGPQSAVAPPSVAEGLYLLRLTRANDVKVQKIVIRK